MAGLEKFEDFEVWKLSRRLAKEVYAISRRGEFAGDYGLKNQIRKSVVSIMSNIAEGFERGSNKEFIQFLFIAKGSAGEARAQLCIALDLGYIEKGIFDRLNAKLLSISRQLSGFIHYLESSSLRGAKR